MKCVAGCNVFENGDVKHHKDCPLYSESLSSILDDSTIKRKVKYNCNWIIKIWRIYFFKTDLGKFKLWFDTNLNITIEITLLEKS